MTATSKVHKIAFILGIRPDVIRASLILRYLEQYQDVDVKFIWSGQHYSPNLKDIFFQELKVRQPDFDLGAGGETDAEVVAQTTSRLYDVLAKLQPDVAVFLGDTNTVVSCLAAAQLNIPIVHIEGGMRSYDWRMPEEKYRTTIDHLSDLIFVYLEEYRDQAIREGINPRNIEVVGNPIVDIINEFYFPQKDRLEKMATPEFFASRGIKDGQYYAMTCHRRENVHNEGSLRAIIDLVAASPHPVFFPASYRTQKVLKDLGWQLPANLLMVDPIGYEELLVLMTHSLGVLTDSGTVVEEACVLGIPCVQIRKSTERPQVYDVGAAVKFDPAEPEKYPLNTVYKKLASLQGKTWQQPFGDGQSSKRIAEGLYRRLTTGQIRGHQPQDYHLPIDHSYRHDDLKV